MTEILQYKKEAHIVTLTITRAGSMNSLGEPGDGAAFQKIATQINNDREVRCVILTGAGDAFSAGGNIKSMANREGTFGGSPPTIADSYRDNVHEIVRAIWGLQVPAIAAVNGAAVGLGNDIACLCDMRIAANSARFGATFLKIGLIPGDGGAWVLPRIIGHARAAEMLYAARLIDAATAAEWGLVSRVVADDKLMDEARTLAAAICAQPPEALRATKRLLRYGQGSDFPTLLEMSSTMQALLHQTEDHAEAITALLDKRAGTYQDK